MKPKVRPEIKDQSVPLAIEQIDVPSSAAKLKAAIGELDTIFVERAEEIQIIMLAIAAGQHVLLEGKHGVAKSDLAREAFKRITGGRVYDKMFSKGTLPDDVFGPTLMESYKKGEFEHNIEGRLPTAHFANLEELGRASDLLLPAMMTVLNERVFHNGKNVVACPLICAIGTTNFMSDNPELEAYIDRWLARVEVRPLDTNAKCIDMLTRCLKPRAAVSETVSVREVLAINRAVSAIQPEPGVIDLFVDLVKSYAKEAKVPYISDRRLVLAFRLVRAQAVLDGAERVSEEHLDVVKYGIMQTGKSDENTFSSVLSRIVGDAAVIKKENAELKKLEAYVTHVYDKFDPAVPNKELKEMINMCTTVVKGLGARRDAFKVQANIPRYAAAQKKLGDLFTEMQKELSSRT